MKGEATDSEDTAGRKKERKKGPLATAAVKIRMSEIAEHRAPMFSLRTPSSLTDIKLAKQCSFTFPLHI